MGYYTLTAENLWAEHGWGLLITLGRMEDIQESRVL